MIDRLPGRRYRRGWGKRWVEIPIDYGALAPLDPLPTPRTFQSGCLVLVRTAYRLRNDFDLDPPGVAFALSLLNRELEVEVRELQALLP